MEQLISETATTFDKEFTITELLEKAGLSVDPSNKLLAERYIISLGYRKKQYRYYTAYEKGEKFFQ